MKTQKKFPLLILSSIIICLVTTLFIVNHAKATSNNDSFKDSDDDFYKKGNKEYMTVMSKGISGQSIFVSESGTKYFEVDNSKSPYKAKYDYRSVIQVLKDYNNDGWTVISASNSIGSNSIAFTFFVLERDKK